MRRPCGRRSTSHSRLVSAIAAADTSHMAMLQPSATSWRASSRPMPVPPPVMTAIRPARSFMRFPSVVIERWRQPFVPPKVPRCARDDKGSADPQPCIAMLLETLLPLGKVDPGLRAPKCRSTSPSIGRNAKLLEEIGYRRHGGRGDRGRSASSSWRSLPRRQPG